MTGPHPFRASHPHPESLTTRLVAVEVDLKQQILDVCSSLAGSIGRRNTAFSEGSGSLSVLPGSSPITFTSPSSKAHQKSGPFAPPALPGLNAPATLSDSRHDRRLSRR